MAVKKPVIPVAIALAVLAIAVPATVTHYRRVNPDRAFEQIVGRPLPAGIHASSYTWAFNDNFLHVGHYWLLSGPASSLRQIPMQLSLTESTEDARYALPDVPKLFGRPLGESQVLAGYEGSEARNNWYWIFVGESVALYEHNTTR